MQSVIYAAMLHLNPAMAEGLLDARVEKLDTSILNDLLEDHPEYILKMRREFVADLLQRQEFNAFSELLYASETKAPGMRAFLASFPLPAEQRSSLLEREVESLPRNEAAVASGEVLKNAPSLMQALQPETPAEQRAEAAFLLLSRLPDCPEAKGVMAEVPEQYRSALQCLSEAPRTAAEVLPWAEKYHKDASAAVRRAVAGCLLPVDGWRFYMHRQGEKAAALEAQPCVAHRFPDAKRVSCPVSLIRLVQAMQNDEDPAVALVACGSMLYRTGDCNRARLAELLVWLRTLRDDYFRRDGNENEYLYITYRRLCTQLESVWKRWSEYRNGVEEFFKLKGSPKKLRPELDKLLVTFAEAIDDYPYSIIDDVKDQMPTRRKISALSGGAVQPHEFDFPAAPSGVELPGQQAITPSEAEAVTAEDAEEPDTAPTPVAADAPVRVEFFHKDGCDVCGRVSKRLERLRETYPGLEVVDYDVESEAGRERNTVLCSRFGVAPKDRRKAPSLFAESGVLLGEAADSERLESLVKSAHAAGLRTQKLAASQQEKPDSSASMQEAEPAPITEPAPIERLAESSAEESVAATGEQIWELVRSYGMLVIGGLVTLLGLMLLLFGRNKEKA